MDLRNHAPGVALLFLLTGLGCEGRQKGIPPAPPTGDVSAVGIRVKATQLRVAPLAGVQRFTGKTSAGQVARIVAETGGKITVLSVHNGDDVKAGQILLRLDSSRQNLAAQNAKISLKARRIDVHSANDDVVRMEKLLTKEAVTRVQVDAAKTLLEKAKIGEELAEVGVKTAQRALADTVVRAPHDGEVTGLTLGAGDSVAPGMPLFELVNLNVLDVHLALAGGQLASWHKGQRVQVQVDEHLGATLSGVVFAIAPKSDARTGLFDVEIHAENPKQTGGVESGNKASLPRERVRAGLIASVIQQENNSVEQLLIPSVALLRRGGRVGAFIVEDLDGHPAAAFKALQIGKSSGAFSEVLQGANAQQWVVTSEFSALTEGTPLQVERVASPPTTASTIREEGPSHDVNP